MKKIYSNVESNKLLHVIHRVSDFDSLKNTHRCDISDPKEFLQLSALRMEKNKTFKPHKHIWKKGEKECIAQESWVVVRGQVRCTFYDLDDTIIAIDTLNPGDCSMTFEGGHNYFIESDDALVYEYKTGPYKGQKLDKVFIGDQ